MERKTGFEPATAALARQCSTPELLPLLMAGSMGFEPTVSGVTGQRVRPLHYDPASNRDYNKIIKFTKQF
jgi:hypothetical protein